MSNVSAVAKGDLVVMLGFTGMNLGEFKAEAITKSQIHIMNKKGEKLIFDRTTGVQKNVAEGKEKYANKIVLPEDAPANKVKAPAPAAKKSAAPAPKAAAKKAPEPVEDDEEEEAPAPKAKAKAAAPKGKTKSKAVEEEEYEEM